MHTRTRHVPCCRKTHNYRILRAQNQKSFVGFSTSATATVEKNVLRGELSCQLPCSKHHTRLPISVPRRSGGRTPRSAPVGPFPNRRQRQQRRYMKTWSVIVSFPPTGIMAGRPPRNWCACTDGEYRIRPRRPFFSNDREIPSDRPRTP